MVHFSFPTLVRKAIGADKDWPENKDLRIFGAADLAITENQKNDQFAQVVIGCAVGTRFTGYPLREMRRVLLLAAGSSTLMVVLAALTAFGAAAAGLYAPLPLFLALAPGGLAEMSLVALAVGFDTALVATMQILRIAVVVVLAPTAFRLARRLRSRGPEEA